MKPSNQHILIVDDNPEDMIVFKRYINRDNKFKDKVTILETALALEAISIIETNEIDCVLLDYNLPDKTGNELLSELNKRNILLPPVIMLTGQKKIELAVESLKLGAEDYLVKDEITEDSLCRTIHNASEKYALKRELLKKEEEVKKLAFNDGLTGLPNRASLEVITNELISHDPNSKFAIIILDLDRFKNINDTLGHEVGDLLVKIVALRLEESLKENEILVRAGGDEFIIVKKIKSSLSEISDFCVRLIELFGNPFNLKDYNLAITSSIGVAVYPIAGKTMTELLKCADIAMFRSKDMGGNQFSFFTEEINRLTIEKVEIENALREAIKNNLIKVFFQPIVNLDDESLYAIEALIRFENKLLSIHDLEKIMNIAEQSSLMIKIGHIMLQKAISEYANLKNTLKKAFHLTINLSAKQLESKTLTKDILSICNKYTIKPSELIFELTESAFIHNMDRASTLLSKLIELGSKIYIDDFGTGYSSLSLIQNLPISGLKIDKSFVMDMENKSKNAKLVNSIIILAQANGLSVTAEGVETATELNMLKLHPNVKAQGFYISKPVAPKEIVKFKM